MVAEEIQMIEFSFSPSSPNMICSLLLGWCGGDETSIYIYSKQRNSSITFYSLFLFPGLG